MVCAGYAMVMLLFLQKGIDMSAIKLEIIDRVHVLTMLNGDNDNRFTTNIINEFISAIDQVIAYEGNTALMLTCEHEKTWSTGINLDWYVTQNASQKTEFMHTLNRFLCKLDLLNAPTIACINGNTYAGAGLMFAALDFRYMRADRGRICYPEVDVKIPFTPMMYHLLAGFPKSALLKKMLLAGVPVTGQQACEVGIVDGLFDKETLQTECLNIAKQMAQKDRATYTSIKHGLKANMIAWAIENNIQINA